MGKREERAGLKAKSSASATSDEGKKKRRKQVSERVVAKRRLEFERRSAGKGEAEAVPNKAWAQFYDAVVGEEERKRIQVNLAREDPREFICSLFLSDQPTLSQLRLERVSARKVGEGQSGTRSYVIRSETLKDARLGELKNSLQRESRLGRCLLKRHSGVFYAMQEFIDVKEGALNLPRVCLEIDPDTESKQWCLELGRKFDSTCCLSIAPHHQGKRVPLFDLPNAFWTVFDRNRLSPLMFDRILCRVPSSLDGAFRDRPSGWRSWKSGFGRDLAPLQLSILQSTVQALKKGGELLYFTKSLNPLENECVIASLLKSLKGGKGLELVPVRDRHGFHEGLVSLKGKTDAFAMTDDEILARISPFCVRAHPQDSFANDEGFFYCKVRRTTDKPLEWLETPSEEALSVANDVLLKLGLGPYSLRESDLTESLNVMRGLKKHPELLEKELDFSSRPRDSFLQNLVTLADSERIVAIQPGALQLWMELELPFIRYGVLVATRGDGDSWIPEQDSLWMYDSCVDESSLKRIILKGEEAEEAMREILSIGKVSELSADTEVKLLTLDLASAHVNESEDWHQEGKARLSKAARKKLKRDSTTTTTATPKSGSTLSRRCILVVGPAMLRDKADETEAKETEAEDLFVLNDEDWIKSCEEIMFASV